MKYVVSEKTGFRKPTKTISGVAPLAVMIPPRKCEHGACLYCPSLNAPQSYTPESPAVLRAKACEYDPYRQVKTRLQAFKSMGHPTDKIELIIMGGTFLSFPRKFQFDFVKRCYDALNNRRAKDLKQAKKWNEKAKNRCVAMCIETRPNVCSDEQVADMLEWGATRCELGVQFADDKMYVRINRGHTVKDVFSATERLKRAGFKIGYHLMPGLPGSNPRRDLKMFKKIFSSKKFRPDQIKIYPCQVLKGADLEKWYHEGRYVPYDKSTTLDLILKIMKIVPRYCRVMRVMREIPPSFLTAGILNIDLRKDVEDILREKGVKINEIRFREIGFAMRDGRKIDEKVFLRTTKYRASGGTEYFIEVVNSDDILFGLLRLRLEKNKNESAMVRELHVYGPALNLEEHDAEKFQHKGFGKMLLDEAEKFARKKGRKEIKIISGVGVREYYRKFGYEVDKEGIYIGKKL